MRSGDLVCTTRCEVDDDDCEIWFGGSDDGTKKEENLLNFSVFSIFNSLHLFNLTSLLPHSTPHASLPQTKRKAPQLLLFAVVFPKWREKKMRDVFSPFTHFAAGLCARLSFLFHFSFTSIQFTEEEEQWRDEKMMGEEERKKKEGKKVWKENENRLRRLFSSVLHFQLILLAAAAVGWKFISRFLSKSERRQSGKLIRN